jgi:LCP family protein required for cell wall assembly
MENAPEPDAAASAALSSPPPPGETGHRRGRSRMTLLLGLLLALTVGVAAVAYLLAVPRPGVPGTGGVERPVAAPAKPASPAPSAAPSPAPKPRPVAVNILLVGSDSRVNERAAAATGAASDQRGDALVFIHLPADRQGVYGISIMRDLWVDVPGHGTAKINMALALGGLPLMTQTVQALLGQHIDHTVMLDFQGFAALTDALGGVDVDIKQPFTGTVDDKVHFAAGVHRLNGVQALAFVRERHAFTDGDYQRVRNQQTFLKAVMAKMAAEGKLANPATVRNLIRTVLPHVTLDRSFTAASLEELTFSLRSTAPGRGTFFTLPTAGTGFSADGQSIVLPDKAGIAAVAAALAAGRLPQYAAAHR